MAEIIQGYCIGKATRHIDGDMVSKPPYEQAIPENLYDLLRSAIFPSQQHAELACRLAHDVNPVGFVILVVHKEGT